MEENLSTVNAEPEVNVEPQNNEPINNEPVQTNNAEVVEPQRVNEPQQKTVQSPEENARFAEIRRKAEAEAKDKLIAEMYGESHGIHTYAEFLAAKQQQEEEEKLAEMLEKNIPEEYAKEMLENRKFREQFEAEKKAKQQQEQQQADMKDFITAFPDVKADEIPAEVWQANAKGIPLRYAYAEHALKQTMKAQEIAKANETNAKSSTGSVSTNGTTGETYYTPEQVKAMSPSEVKKNFTAIEKSMKRW